MSRIYLLFCITGADSVQSSTRFFAIFMGYATL